MGRGGFGSRPTNNRFSFFFFFVMYTTGGSSSNNNGGNVCVLGGEELDTVQRGSAHFLLLEGAGFNKKHRQTNDLIRQVGLICSFLFSLSLFFQDLVPR